MIKKIKVTTEDQGERLDKFLVKYYPQLSRSQIQKAIKDGLILINDNHENKHYSLEEGDIIKSEIKAKDYKIAAPNLSKNKKIKLDIIFEDENYLVINKQANLIVHPSSSHPENDTLINGVIAHYPKIKSVGEDPARPGIVHRLDKEVSGLIALTKTENAFEDLKSQFKNRKVYKEYIALVHGVMSEKNGKINFNIERSKTKGFKMAARPDQTGKEAVTEYDVIKEYNNYSLLKVIIHTGRTHQIRVHLSALGHPVVGDRVYKPRNLKTRIELDRIFLHSHKLEFTNLESEKVKYTAELPEELNGLLKTLD
ncbi:MAG: RluA family pseudouridine synthase [Patescibacteria group bacterium]